MLDNQQLTRGSPLPPTQVLGIQGLTQAGISRPYRYVYNINGLLVLHDLGFGYFLTVKIPTLFTVCIFDGRTIFAMTLAVDIP